MVGIANVQELQRSNLARENETLRSNLNREEIQRRQNEIRSDSNKLQEQKNFNDLVLGVGNIGTKVFDTVAGFVPDLVGSIIPF